MSCQNVILFYESHSDKNPAIAITQLADTFKQIGIKSYCFEEPSDVKRVNLLQTYKSGIEFYGNIANAESFDDPYIQIIVEGGQMIVWDEKKGAHKKVTPDTHLSRTEKQDFTKGVKSFCRNMENSLKATIGMLMQADNKNFKFCAMDMPSEMREKLDASGKTELENSAIRSAYMKSEIMKQCDSNGDVLALVGASHFDIARLLRDEGIRVKEYFVTKDPVRILSEEWLSEYMADLCLRTEQNDHPICHNHQFDGLVVDLNANPYLYPSELIADDLAALIPQHDEL